MKRFLIGFSIIIIIVLLTAIVFLRTSSGFRSIYLVPENAVILVETKDPLLAWYKIVHSKAWNHLSTNEFLQELNTEVQSYDSLVNSSKMLLKLIGKKSVMISEHPVGHDKYELLYIIDVGKIAKYKKPEKIFNSILGNSYEITSRTYKEQRIVEILNIEEGEYYFITLLHGKLVFSFESKLLEASIDASEKMIIGRERKFLDVYSKIGNKGLFSVFINHNNLSRFISAFSEEAKETFEQKGKHFCFSGISFTINEEGLITVEGYTSFSDTQHSYKSLLHNGLLELESVDVIPLRLASLGKINFKDAEEYFYSSMKTMGEDEYALYKENLEKIEKKFKISLEENFFSWMNKEIVMLQTQPSNLGRSNEFAVVLHTTDSADASENLQYVWKQLKKNSPVKIKTVNYKGYRIDYIAFPGILKLFFGQALSKIEKPYFTQIGNNVIISNHPQTLKNTINDYVSGATLNTSVDYYNFLKLFDNRTALFAYFEPPVLFSNLKDFLSPKSWQNLKKNKKYFTCFNQAGVQVELSDDLLHFILKTQYKPVVNNWKLQYYNSTEIFSLFNSEIKIDEKKPKQNPDTIPVIIIPELDVNKHEEFYNDGTLKRSVELKNGLKHGGFREYYTNGELRIKGSFENDIPTGKWKYYDKEGELVKTDKY